MPPGNKHVGHQDHQNTGRIFGLPRPFAWDEAARLAEIGWFDPPYHPRFPKPRIEYTFDPATGLLLKKDYYDSPAHAIHIFEVTFDWDADEYLTDKHIRRKTDTSYVDIHYEWDTNTGLLLNKTYSGYIEKLDEEEP